MSAVMQEIIETPVNEKIAVSVETITPEIAAEYLLTNTHNFRKPNRARVLKYSREILLGQWSLNGEAIKFSDGVLIDGQHRLLAVIEAKTAIQTLVIRGSEIGSMSLDRGMARTLPQECANRGIKYALTIPTAARRIIHHNRGNWDKPTIRGYDVADSEIMHFIIENQKQLELCCQVADLTKRIIPVGIMAPILFIASDGENPRNNATIMWFVEGLRNGNGLTIQDAALHLRNKMINQTKHRKIPNTSKSALLTLAWNKTALGEACTPNQMSIRLTGPTKQAMPKKIELAPKD